MNSLLTVREAVIAYLPAWEPHRTLSRSMELCSETAWWQLCLQEIDNIVLARVAGLTFPAPPSSPLWGRTVLRGHGLHKLAAGRT